MAISTTPVNQAHGSGTTALTITITAAASGNFLLLCVSLIGSSLRTVSTVTCTNVTWTNIKRGSNGTLGVEIWQGVVAGGSSGTSVTFTFSGATTFTAGNVSEWSGVATVSPLDGTPAISSGTSTHPAIPALTTLFGNDIVISAEAHKTGTTPSVNPLTALTAAASSTSLCCQGVYLVPAAAGSQGGGTWTIASSGDTWATVVAAFKVAVKTQSLSSTPTAFAATMSKTDDKPFAASKALFAGGVNKGSQIPLTAAPSSFAGAISKLTNQPLLASMGSPWAGFLVRGRILNARLMTFGATLQKVMLKNLVAAWTTWAGSIVKQTKKVLTATMSAWAASLMSVLSKIFTATMAAFSGAISKITDKFFNAT